MIARLKQAAWDAEEAERPPPPPPPAEAEDEEVIDAEPPVEEEPQASPEVAEAEHSALIERLKQAALAFNESEDVQAHRRRQPRSRAAEDPVVVGGALYGRSAYDAPYVPPAEEERVVVQPEDDREAREDDATRDYSGPVANAIAFAREMRAAREARGREAAKAVEEVVEAEPEVPYELTRSWEPETALFRISGRVLPMHLERPGMTPSEVTRIWEKEWGIAYASRLRFEAPPEAATKWLSVRGDELPPPPTVTRLDGKPPILDAVALALTQRDEDLFQKSLAAGEERFKEAVVSHGGKWVKKSETFRWSSPSTYDEEQQQGLHPIWPPMEPPPMPER